MAVHAACGGVLPDHDGIAVEAQAAADHCPHGEGHWQECDVCREDERGVRLYERRLDR